MSAIGHPGPRVIVRDAIKALEDFALQRSRKAVSPSINVVRLRPRPRAEAVDRQPMAPAKTPASIGL